MKCPHCCSENIGIVDTLPGASNTQYRRRKCKDCNGLFRTVEIVDNGSPSFKQGYYLAERRKRRKYGK